MRSEPVTHASRPSRELATTVVLVAAVLAVACPAAARSARDPAGREAERIAALTWWMFLGAAVIWLAVIGLTFHCLRPRSTPLGRRQARLIVIVGGAIVPTVVLAVLLVFGLAMLPELVAPAPAGSLTVSVAGELWWWRVRYPSPEGQPAALANEIHLPVGEPVEFRLESDNVIHSFWVPALGGKMDMIPGRVTRLALTPTRTGVFPGACAEYCGTSHARMRFLVVVQERGEFDRWLARQAEPARPPTEPLAFRGRDAFLAHGCAACHTVRGTPATGVIGPDLTHVGDRLSLAAGTLRSGAGDFRRWIAVPDELKPGAHMPGFSMLPPEDLQALAAYLEGLK